MSAPLRVTADDDLKAQLEDYAKSYGISLADAVRILLREALNGKALSR